MSSVNVIIRLILSLLTWPKVITLSGYYCNLKLLNAGWEKICTNCDWYLVLASWSRIQSSLCPIIIILAYHQTSIVSSVHHVTTWGWQVLDDSTCNDCNHSAESLGNEPDRAFFGLYWGMKCRYIHRMNLHSHLKQWDID